LQLGSLIYRLDFLHFMDENIDMLLDSGLLGFEISCAEGGCKLLRYFTVLDWIWLPSDPIITCI
jgi:hypothetical protein